MTISVVIPTKNRSEQFEKCLKSIHRQTARTEIIVIDCSDNDKWEYDLNNPEGVDEYYHLSPDPGFTDAWRLGAAMATGDLLHFALDDDWKEPTFLEECAAMMLPDVGMVFTNATIHFPDGTTRKNFDSLDGGGYYKSEEIEKSWLSMPMTISPSCYMIRREDALKYLHPGKIPFTKYASPVNEVFMGLATLTRYPRVGVIDKCLAHFSAGDDCYTMSHMNGGPEKYQKMIRDYATIKQAYLNLKSGL